MQHCGRHGEWFIGRCSKCDEEERSKDAEASVLLDAVEAAAELTQVAGWRLLCLIDSYRKAHAEPCPLELVETLASIAGGEEDLHVVCAALEHGCSPAHARAIFT
jgi:hypothetical protein